MKVTVQTKSGQFEYEVDEGETLLAGALRNAITLPYECATGTCGTCRGRVMTGDCHMAWDEAPGAERLKREKGDCLLCQTTARSDVLVRVPSSKVADSFERGHVPRHCLGTIMNSHRLTHDVMHFDVSLDHPISFDAGQFVTLTSDQVEGARAYSMVNYASDTRSLSFVVKRFPGGGFSDWLFENAVDGAELKIFGALGAATFYPEEDRNIICLGGGSGIAGMMSILDRACQEGYFADHAGYVFFGVRTMADCFYMAELSEFAQRAGANLSVTVVLSDEDPGLKTHPGL